MDYYKKYIKYKQKYLQKKLSGGLSINEYTNLKYNCTNLNNIIICDIEKYKLNNIDMPKTNVSYYIEDMQHSKNNVNKYNNVIINDMYNTTWINLKEEYDNEKYLIKTLFQNNNIFTNYNNCEVVNKHHIIVKNNILIITNIKNINNIKNENILNSFNIIKSAFCKKIKMNNINDEILWNIIKNFNKYYNLDYNIDNTNKIVLFSNDLLSVLCYYYTDNTDNTLHIINNNLLCINICIIIYFGILEKINRLILFSFFMPIQYIIEEKQLKNYILSTYDYGILSNLINKINSNYYKNYKNAFILNTISNNIDENIKNEIYKNYDLLFNIYEYTNNKWIPIFNNNLMLLLMELFNLKYMYLLYHSEKYKNNDNNFLFFYREKNKINGNYAFYEKNASDKRFFCNFNSLKIYKKNKWIIAPYYVLLPFADFVQNNIQSVNITTPEQKDFTIKYNKNNSILYIEDNKEYIISNNYKLHLYHTLVYNYYFKKKNIYNPNIDEVLEIFTNYELYQLLDIRTNQFLIKTSNKNKVSFSVFGITMDDYSNVFLIKNPPISNNILNDLFIIKNDENAPDLPNNILTLSYNNKKNTHNIIYNDLEKYLKLTEGVQECVNIIFTNVLLIAFMNNLLFDKNAPCYLVIGELNDNIYINIIKNAIIFACGKIDELQFILNIVFLCKDGQDVLKIKQIFMDNNDVFI